MAAAIKTVVVTKELKSSSAVNTVDFLQNVHNIFDCLNSRVLKSNNPYKSAVSNKNRLVLETLKDAVQYINTWKVYGKKKC